VTRTGASDYALLKDQIRSAGLFARQPRFYVLFHVFAFAQLAACVWLLSLAHSTGRVALVAIILGPVFGLAASCSHDCGHRAMLPAGRANDAAGLFLANVMLGVSWSWWRAKHNAHHSHPNDPDLDPDVNIGVLAFSVEQAREKRGVARWVTRHQALLFLLLLPFEIFQLQSAGFKHLLRTRPPYRGLELALLLLRPAAFLAALALVLPWPSVVVAFVVAHLSLGAYFGSIFAPNHKGMPLAPDGDYFRRQVVTARNVRVSRLPELWFIGLNYQIEHHLFPTLPRNSLRRARPIVRGFCEARGVAYAEVGFLRSWVEILRGLSEASGGVNDVVGTAGGATSRAAP